MRQSAAGHPFAQTGPVLRLIIGHHDLLIEGRAFVDFVVNRTEIRPDYRGNRKEIAKIIESIDKVKNDPDATITRITISKHPLQLIYVHISAYIIPDRIVRMAQRRIHTVKYLLVFRRIHTLDLPVLRVRLHA